MFNFAQFMMNKHNEATGKASRLFLNVSRTRSARNVHGYIFEQVTLKQFKMFQNIFVSTFY